MEEIKRRLNKKELDRVQQETTYISKSEKKRQSLALQEIGEKLASLSLEERGKLNLPADLAEALLEHDRIGSREGRRRQRQFIGKLMREMADEQAGKALIEKIRKGNL